MNGEFHLDFGLAEAAAGYRKVGPDNASYSVSQGFGFEDTERITFRDRGMSGELRRDFCIPPDSVFLVDLPGGRYNVTVWMGDAITATETTVKSGTGRLMVKALRTWAGQFERYSFSVLVENGQLRLAFSGLAPRLNALDIEPSDQTTVIFLAGDSTVTDQPADGYPYAGWGQMLPYLFKAETAVSNHAVSGRSSKSFIDEGRLDAIRAAMRPNDYLFVQFGHNDQKTDAARHTDPDTTYPAYLKQYIDTARACGAKPVLITPVQRRLFEEGRLLDTHRSYTAAMKVLAEAEDVPLIDLAGLSFAMYEELGEEGSKALFLWAAPGEFPNFPGGAQDNTHFQEHGAIRIARLVADAIRGLRLQPLVMYLR